MLHVVTCLWDANRHSMPFSVYDESWVIKLHAGVGRHLTKPFRFVCFTERERKFPAGIGQERLSSCEPDYGFFVEPYRLNEPMILMGLDTIICGNIDHIAKYALNSTPDAPIALPRDPCAPHRACNGVALVPGGKRHIYDAWRGENDMEWMRRYPHVFTDDIFPGEIKSWKCHVRALGPCGVRICYFHGAEKVPELLPLPWFGDWAAANWRA